MGFNVAITEIVNTSTSIYDYLEHHDRHTKVVAMASLLCLHGGRGWGVGQAHMHSAI